jgi:hypothetical protein
MYRVALPPGPRTGGMQVGRQPYPQSVSGGCSRGIHRKRSSTPAATAIGLMPSRRSLLWQMHSHKLKLRQQLLIVCKQPPHSLRIAVKARATECATLLECNWQPLRKGTVSTGAGSRSWINEEINTDARNFPRIEVFQRLMAGRDSMRCPC